MKTILACAVALFATCMVFGQNLVLNPSFENVTQEPTVSCQFQYMQDWINPSNGTCGNFNEGTPDIFSYNSTGNSQMPNTFMGSLAPHSGTKVVGFGMYVQDIADYREYIMSRLTSPLVVGQKYLVKLWIRNSNPPTYIFHSNSIQVAFTSNALTQTGDDLIPNITPQLSIDSVVRDTTWRLFHFLYTPTQPYQYMTIGNFRNDANTIKEQFGVNNGTNRRYAYYFFDDISVETYKPMLTLSDTNACIGRPVSITAGNSITGEYHWFVPGSNTYIDNDSILNVNVTQGATYIVTDGFYNDTIVINGLTVGPNSILGPDTSFCSSSPYILNATQPGSTYQWSNGATTPFIATTTAGMYSVTVTGANGCPVADSIYLAIALPLTATFQVTQPSCGNNNGVLTCLGINGFAPINVQWNTGGNNIGSTYQVSNLGAGTYYFNAIDAIGCTIDTSFVLVNTTGTGSVAVSSSADTICGGGAATICAPSGFVSYQWNNGATTQCISTRQAGNYYVTVTDGGNCTASSLGQSLYAYPLPPVSVTVNGDTMTAYNGITYQWYFNGEVIAGATGSQYVATQNGTYAVVITDDNGCGASSNGISMVRTDIGILVERDIVVYPNPNANGTWYVQLANDMFDAQAQVYDYSGKLVYDAVLMDNTNTISFDAASGVYVLKVKTGSNTITKKLIKL